MTVQPEMVTENLEEDQDQDPRKDQAKRNQGLLLFFGRYYFWIRQYPYKTQLFCDMIY